MTRPVVRRGARGGAHPADRAGRKHERGQATAEFALVLPLIVLFLFALIQTALIARDRVLVTHAARAAVREASVDASDGRARAAAHGVLAAAEVTIRRGPRIGDEVVVEVRYVSHTSLPLVGPLLPDVTMHERATMRRER